MQCLLRRNTFLTIILMGFLACSVSAQPIERPNIVFILIDDLGWTDVGFMGSEYYHTPNLDRLANGGMIFTQAYANAANCAPTRASLLSGQYTPRHGIYTVANPDRGKSANRRLISVKNNRAIALEKITIAEALKPSGYVSAAIGKWHIGNSPSEQGFAVGLDRDKLGYKGGHFNEDGEYLADQLTDEAIKFIRNNHPRQTGKPFFLYLSHHAVHTPIQAKEEIIEKFINKSGTICHRNPAYAAMIQSVDESVARVNKTLEELKLSENTILIFFSDNGGHGAFTCQKPLRGGKGMFYEGGIREPMFVYWPGKVKPGSICETPIISTDFYPTFLDLANAEKPAGYPLDGKSILPLLKGKKSLKRSELFWHFPAYLQAYDGLKEDSRDPIFRTRPVSVIRKGDWKLMLFHEEWVLDGGLKKISSNNSVELYYLKKDISEVENLNNSKVKKRNKLLNELLAWQYDIQAPIPTIQNSDYVHPENP